MANTIVKRFILLLSITVMGSCSFVAKNIYGGKTMKVQNAASIKNWMQHNHFDTSTLFTVQPKLYTAYFFEHFKTPILYNSYGKFINSGACYKTFDDFLLQLTYVDKFKAVDKQVLDDNPTFSEIFNPLVNIRGASINIAGVQDNCDFILVLPFALALGNKMQVTDLKKYYKAANTNKNVVIKVVFINLDKQQWWGSEWNKNIRMRI